MTSEDTRDPEDTGSDPGRSGAGPAVGNVLGFSLLFRARRALLAVSGKSLVPGVRLREYEAVIPGVRLPLRGPLKATKFRNRRCRTVYASLTIEDRVLRPWLRERLLGADVLGVTLDRVELEMRRELPEVERHRPCLMLGGVGPRGGRVWLLAAFDLAPVHRLIELRPHRLWLVGELPPSPHRRPSARSTASVDAEGRDQSARRLWQAIARRLAAGPVAGLRAGIDAGPGGALRVDVGRLAMTRAFASVGWKAPNLEGCALESLALTRRGLKLELRGPMTEAEPGEEAEHAGDEPPSTPQFWPEASEDARAAVAPVEGELGLLDEPIGRALDEARGRLRLGDGSNPDLGPALDILRALSRELADFPAAHLALVRWRVSLTRFLDREACLDAVHEWLDLQPSADEPRRLLATLLAAEGRAQELARLLAAACRQPHPPATQGRLELAVASLLIDRLDDPRSALSIVGPLTQRLREELARARDQVRERRAGARRGASPRNPTEPETGADGDPHRALARELAALLPEALVVLARARIAEVAREGRSLAAVPHVLEALEEALEGTPNPRRRADLRAQVADSFAVYGDDHDADTQALGLLRAAIGDAPEDRELLDRAIALALRAEHRAIATELLRRRLELAEPEERPSLRKRLIAVAVELDDPEHRELARAELILALEREPDNAVLLRRGALLEGRLGNSEAAAEYLGRLLELDQSGAIELDDRDELLLSRARLLRRAGRIDPAWESLRPALARIPGGEVTATFEVAERELPWILDVLELGLELAPPTDRPRILDLLITYARGQRRGEALVERAAQALRIDERVEDLWLAVDELERPEKILGQLEQLLDERDVDGLARLADIAAELGEAATELHARGRLGRALMAREDFESLAEAADNLERALELDPERLDLRRALADAYEGLDRPAEALPQLERLLDASTQTDVNERGRLSLRIAATLRELGDAPQAAEILAACERELARLEPEAVDEAVREAVADESFAALRELAEDDRALTVALEQAGSLWAAAKDLRTADPHQARRLGAWLARAARVLDEAGVEDSSELSAILGQEVQLPEDLPRTRVGLLERAVGLRPEDSGLARGLEDVLRELGDREALEAHLRRQTELNVDPELRAELLERLIEVVEDSIADGHATTRDAELAELLEDLLVLRPEHTPALLLLGRLRFDEGDGAQALQLWAVAGERLATDDPRFFVPALELARDAIDAGEHARARELAERARRLDPEHGEPLELLAAIAEAQDDPELLALALGGLLSLEVERHPDLDRALDAFERAGVDDERGASLDRHLAEAVRVQGRLELDLANALDRWHGAEANAGRARAAVAHFARAERLYPARDRDQDRSRSTRRWLALAEQVEDFEQQAWARAVLRETLGDELELDDHLAEVDLLDGPLGRPLAALGRLDELLHGTRREDPRVLDRLAALLEAHEGRETHHELAVRSHRVLRSAAPQMAPGPTRLRAVRSLLELAQGLDDPSAVAFALELLAEDDPEALESGELAQLRDWAVRRLGRVSEAVAELEARLGAGELPPERLRAGVRRLLGLLDGDTVATVERLLELGARAERGPAADLAEAALDLLGENRSELGDDPDNAARWRALDLQALELLASSGRADALVARWGSVEATLVASGELRELVRLVELAAATELDALHERADALLYARLPERPDDPGLLDAVWRRAAAGVLLGEGELGRAAVVGHVADWVEGLLAREAVAPESAARTLAGLAARVEDELDATAAATFLRERAEQHLHDGPLFTELLEVLHQRERWPELLTLLELARTRSEADSIARQTAENPHAWLRVAEAAGRTGDVESEVRARVRAGDRLAAAAGLEFETDEVGASGPVGALFGPSPTEDFDFALAETSPSALRLSPSRVRPALAELTRALSLDPERADLRWRLALGHARLGDSELAFTQLDALWQREQWSAAGVERGELAFHAGSLAAKLGRHERAVELLTPAHARSSARRRGAATERLYSALLAVDRTDEAARVASTRAGEVESTGEAVAWLRRAAGLSEGARRVELLTRALELDPDEEGLVDELEAELREAGEAGALDKLLHQRLARCRSAGLEAGFDHREFDPLDAKLQASLNADLAPELRATWVSSLESLIGLRASENAEDLDLDPDAQAERVALHEELLTLAPDHTEALMIVAESRRRQDRRAQALELWARAEPALADDDPRLFEIACRLAERELAKGRAEGARAEAHRLLERALGQRPDDLDALERRHEVACALDNPELVLAAAQALLERPAGLPGPRVAELEGDVARAQTLLGDLAGALDSLERAVGHATPASELHRDLVQRWLELLDHPELQAGDPLVRARRELDARVELRHALGPELSREQAVRELDLLTELGEIDEALERVEGLLIVNPESADLRNRLTQIAALAPSAPESDGEAPVEGSPLDPEAASERVLRTLRRVVDALNPGPARDDLSRELALAARTSESARTALEALDRLSGAAAATPEMLDLRVWAVRKLDRVEDELGELDRSLLAAESVGNDVLLNRLMRVLEHDAGAGAARLIQLANSEAATIPAQVWLLEASLELLTDTNPGERLELGVEAVAALIERVAQPEVVLEIDADESAARQRVAGVRRHWQQLAATALHHGTRDRRALESAAALIRTADRAARAALPGFGDLGEMLLDRATVDFPDHSPLHALASQRLAEAEGETEGEEKDPTGRAQIAAALARVEGLADANRMDARERARLYLGLAGTLDEASRAPFLRDVAGYHGAEPAIFAPLREALRKLGAFAELVALLESVGAEPEHWRELAEDAAVAGADKAEGKARRCAGLGLYERLLAEERAGGGLAEHTLERACVELARARELRPDDLELRYVNGRALERAGQTREALGELVELVAVLDPERDGESREGLPKAVELGPLARRCGLLALEAGESPRAAELLDLAYRTAPEAGGLRDARARLAVAERLFTLLADLSRDANADAQAQQAWTAQALDLARRAAVMAEAEGAREGGDWGDGDAALRWLERAARLAEDEHERAALYARALELSPEDERIADAYEASLRALDDGERLEALLRKRIAVGLDGGDRARTVGLVERLLGMLPMLELADDEAESESEAEGEAKAKAKGPSEAEVSARMRERAELLEHLLRLAPERLEPRLELADLRMLEGDREAAASHWRSLAQRLPTGDRRFLEPARQLARIALDNDELERARGWLERAMAIEPDSRETLMQLLEVGRGLGDDALILANSETLLSALDNDEAAEAVAASVGEHDPGEEGRQRARAKQRAILLLERARIFERTQKPERALSEVKAAAGASLPGSAAHIEAAELWLRLTTRDGVRVLLRQDEAQIQAKAEAEARAELRRALGDGLPARAFIAEADLIAERLEQREEAVELLLTGMRLHPTETDLVAHLEELCVVAGEQARFVRILSAFLGELAAQRPEPSDPDRPDRPDREEEYVRARSRLGEKLARAARAIDDPRTCLEALDALPPAVAERPELLELRDWAVRGLGDVDEELARLDQQILELPAHAPAERLQALVRRMLRLLGEAGERCARRLLALSERPELARASAREQRRALARTALRIAREYAPDQLEVTLEALRATLQYDSVKAIAAWWSGVESLAIETGRAEALHELLRIAIEAEQGGDPAYGTRADRLAAAALRADAGALELHRLILRRAEQATLARLLNDSPEAETQTADTAQEAPNDQRQRHVSALAESVLQRHIDAIDALVRELDVHGEALAAVWRGASQALDARIESPEPGLPGPALHRVVGHFHLAVRERCEAALDDRAAFMGLLDLLRARGRWAMVLDLTLWFGERREPVDVAMLDSLADAAAKAGDDATRQRARVVAGERRVAERDHVGAAESFADALAVASVAGERREDLQYRLGDALALAGRHDAALEHLLPLLPPQTRDRAGTIRELERSVALLAEQLGLDPKRAPPSLRLDALALTRRCGELLLAVGQDERAAELLSLSFELSEDASSTERDPRRDPIAEALFTLELRREQFGAAARLAERMAAETRADPDQRLRWLLRVAEHGEPERQAEALGEARVLAPEDHALTARLEGVLSELGESARLGALLRAEIEHARHELEQLRRDPQGNAAAIAEVSERGATALRKLIVLHLDDADADANPASDPSQRGELWEALLDFVPGDLDATLALAKVRAQEGREAEAARLWREAGAALPEDDERFFAPALRLAAIARDAQRFDEARALLERALLIQPGELSVLERLRELAIAADDPEAQLRAIEALLEQPARSAPESRTELLLEAGRAHTLLGHREGTPGEPAPERVELAIRAFERAAAAAPPHSAVHREVAAAWLALVETGVDPLTTDIDTLDASVPAALRPEMRQRRELAWEREAQARAQLRAAFDGRLGAMEMRLEASILAIALGRGDEGLSLVESALLDHPDDALLMSALKDLCVATGEQTRYADALDSAIAALSQPTDAAETNTARTASRDRLAAELAFTAVELGDAERLLAQLDRMSPQRAASPELLDLREWAIRKLGLVEDELSEIDEELLAARASDETEALVSRLLRMLEHDFQATGRRLGMLAERAPAVTALNLRNAALQLLDSAPSDYFDVVLGVVEQALVDADAAREQKDGDILPVAHIPPAFAPRWTALETTAMYRGDPGHLALLLELGMRAVALGLDEIAPEVESLRDRALVEHPASPELHALILGHVEVELAGVDREARLIHADATLEQLAARLEQRHHLPPNRRAMLWVGFGQLFERRDAAALLARRARVQWNEDAEFAVLVDALEDAKHWTRALELLELRVTMDTDDARRVADLKHLAHLCADILGDPDAAIGHLERALELAPEDPDLMLPLLDHYYAKPQLDRAIELSLSVLELVPMGAVAFAALGHRAADAALATGEHDLAEKLLRKILGRVPDEARTRDRLRELEQLAGDPEHRVRMLAAIANRTAGSARVEALEERARLLTEPLGRLEEAIADLEAVNEEAPGRAGAVAALAELYEQRQRWTALVELLEREYPRQQGLDRVLTLERIAAILRDRVDALPRAESSLRLALDNLDSLSERQLQTQLSERPDLLEELSTVLLLADGGAASELSEMSEATELDTDALFDAIVESDEPEPEPEPGAGASESGARPLVPPPPPTSLGTHAVSLELAQRASYRLSDRLQLALADVLERRGRYSALIAHLDGELTAELRGLADPRRRFPGLPNAENPRLHLLQRLARALGEHGDDGERTARVYVLLEQLDALPDAGLATLARWYRSQQRYDDLVRILTVRSRKLAQLGDFDRKAEADFRIGELLEGPLRRPHEAARFFLDAYLANPLENPRAGSRARVLLAGTDSVINVRNRLLLRLPELREDYKPSLLALLADLLSPHDDHELEAERRYREALEIDGELANALEGLGRLLARQGRLEDAVEPLSKAATSPQLPDDRAADDAASAARALIELEREPEAEAVLRLALERAPESQRALFELARLYDRMERGEDQSAVLDRLAALPLSSSMRAEVGYRQAMVLAADFREDPMSEAGERARALLLEAIGADAMHAQARQMLLDLATARSEWSIVAHMYFLAIRELPPGPRRALTHLDLAETYLDRLSDAQSALRNLAAAIQQAATDVVVVNRAIAIVGRLPAPGEAATRLEQLARSPGRPEEKIEDAARARLLLIAAELHLRNDTLPPAIAAAKAATAYDDVPPELRAHVASRYQQIVEIDQGEFDLRKRRKALRAEFEACEDPIERLELLGRLRDIARTLDEREAIEQLTKDQLELAHELLDDDVPEHRNPALALLRNVFAESGDYGRIVNLYEDLAARTGNSEEAASLLSAAARFAWSGLRDPKLAVAVVRRALDRDPTHAPATKLLGDIAGASDEREVDQTICDELSQLSPRQRPPLLTLRLAEAALRLERREQAQGVLRQLLAGEAPVDLRLSALNLLDGLLETAGRTHDRIPLLEERLELCRRHWPDRAADVALELARAQRAVGNLVDARATCRTALLDKPSDQGLTRLYAELLEQAEDWGALARALEQLANLTIETTEQAHWLTRAAQVHLDHGDATQGGGGSSGSSTSAGKDSMLAARRLLERARAVSTTSTEARSVLLPLVFTHNDHDRVLELAIELRSIAGDTHEALLYAALTEAVLRGKRTLARSIGDRHESDVRQRVLWPATAQLLDGIAREGPLPRLDALLSAAAALCGGTEELLDELGAWAAGQPVQAGLALGLARLNEAFRRMALARNLYQIAAYMAPSGPVPVLTTRLPASELPREPIHEPAWIPLEWRGALRDVLLQLRPQLSGIRGRLGNARAARTAKERSAVQQGTRIVTPWRKALALDIHVAVTEDSLPGGVGIRNLSRPTIVLNEDFIDVPEPERRYRMAYAAAALATGLAITFDNFPIPLPDLLDALTALVKPRHEPQSDTAKGLVDTLASRGLTASKLDAELRRALSRELDHWHGAPDKLARVLHRSCMLIATRLSGAIDGALMTMARDRSTQSGNEANPSDPTVLHTADAAWLLRALGVFGGGSLG